MKSNLASLGDQSVCMHITQEILPGKLEFQLGFSSVPLEMTLKSDKPEKMHLNTHSSEEAPIVTKQ